MSFFYGIGVGYGDKTPQSFCGRLFAMAWIIVGLSVFSLLTATLTSDISERHFYSYPKPSMQGAKVKILVKRRYKVGILSSRLKILVKSFMDLSRKQKILNNKPGNYLLSHGSCSASSLTNYTLGEPLL